MGESGAGKEILLAEDDGEYARRLKQFLQPLGYHVDLVSEGHQVLKRVRETAPHLIILDAVMPKMTGFQVARLLKFDPKTRAIPILMLTVLDQASAREQGKAVGVDVFLTKPVLEAKLLETIEQLLK